MNYYENLNKIINKIEENLTNKIDYNELAKIIGTSSYTLQRIFVFLTGITLTEYIRKRRLSNAAEELLLTNTKIIDLALKYQYDSPISFTNAFKKMHGISPQKLRKNSSSLKTFTKIEFKPTIETLEELDYRVIELNNQKLYGITTGIIGIEKNKAIRELFKKARKTITLDFIIENSTEKELYYSVIVDIYKDEITKKIEYYIVGKQPRADFTSIEIPKATWACFKLKSKKQTDILKLYNTIYTKWLPGSKYTEVLNYPQLEIYYENECEVCIPVK